MAACSLSDFDVDKDIDNGGRNKVSELYDIAFVNWNLPHAKFYHTELLL